MTPNFTTTGRPMTGSLQRALDSLSKGDRRIYIPALRASDGFLAPLLHALATELELCGLREAETDRDFRQIMGEDAATDESPWPAPPTGETRRFDPESGEFSDIPGDES